MLSPFLPMCAWMSICALPGHKVRLHPITQNSGFDHDREKVKRYLTIDHVYTLKQTRAYQSSSTVELEEVPGVLFNTVHFESVTEQNPAEDRKHPDYIHFFGPPPPEQE